MALALATVVQLPQRSGLARKISAYEIYSSLGEVCTSAFPIYEVFHPV